jgi:TRAP-type C4-dicarboxylate transport system substrate-binding protein
MRSTAGRIAATALVGAVGVALTACGPAGTKASGAEAPVTLSIGTDDPQGKPAADQIEEFAREVDRLSDGAVVVTPKWHAAGDGPDWDQRVARMAQAGDLDMALTPSRAWDTEGVLTLRALNAPFLIDSDAVLASVAKDDHLSADLMAGLDGNGVTGLALLPEELRHLFSFGNPLLGTDDYHGAVVRTPTSATVSAVYAQLGATTTDDDPDPATQTAIETGYALDPEGIATGNVTLFPKVNVLVLGDAARKRLDADQLDVLRRAAVHTRDWAVDNLPVDAQSAADFCSAGGQVVLASDSDLAALKAATAPVTSQLAADPATATLIGAIEELRSSADDAPPVEACGASAATDGNSDDRALDGVYRFEATPEMLRDAGVTDAVVAKENGGLFTFTFDGGQYCWRQEAEDVAHTNDCEAYTIDGDRMTWTWPDAPQETFTFSLAGDGSLTLRPVGDVSPVSVAWTSVPWTRIGSPG